MGLGAGGEREPKDGYPSNDEGTLVEVQDALPHHCCSPVCFVLSGRRDRRWNYFFKNAITFNLIVFLAVVGGRGGVVVSSNFMELVIVFLIISRAQCRSIHVSAHPLSASSAFSQASVPKAPWLSVGVTLTLLG